MAETKKNINEGYQPSQRNNGYQPIDKGEQRGYQPKPDGNFGYQPANKSTPPPPPPTTGSNIVSPKNDANGGSK